MRFLAKRVHKGITSLLISLLRAYQYVLSPLLPPSCRFRPSCSEYSIQSLHRFGVLRGVLLSLLRLLKCHPFHPGGDDPVPPKLIPKSKTGRVPRSTKL